MISYWLTPCTAWPVSGGAFRMSSASSSSGSPDCVNTRMATLWVIYFLTMPLILMPWICFSNTRCGEKFGCLDRRVLLQFPFPEYAGFVPESLVWRAIARAGYKQRFVNQVFRGYHLGAQTRSAAEIGRAESGERGGGEARGSGGSRG